MGALLVRSTETEDEAEDEVLARRALAYLQESRKYRYIESLVQGGFGCVYRVYDVEAGKPLVIKFTSHTRYMELNMWPKLDHRNILPLYETFTLERVTAFTMPAMWKDLWNVVKNTSFYKEELSFDQSRVWLRDVANALAYLHGKFLCHLDLKLDNVFQKEDGSVCLGGFSSLSDTRKVPEDLYFREVFEPPEWRSNVQMPKSNNATVGDKADMWQYGILALDLLCNLDIAVNCSKYARWSVLKKITPHDVNNFLKSTFISVAFKQEDFSLCQHFLQMILVLKPEQRMSAEEAVAHPFLEIESPSDSTLPIVVDGDRRKLPNEEIEDPSMTVEEVMAAAGNEEGNKEYLPETPSKGIQLLDIKPAPSVKRLPKRGMPFPEEEQIFHKKPRLDNKDIVLKTTVVEKKTPTGGMQTKVKVTSIMKTGTGDGDKLAKKPKRKSI